VKTCLFLQNYSIIITIEVGFGWNLCVPAVVQCSSSRSLISICETSFCIDSDIPSAMIVLRYFNSQRARHSGTVFQPSFVIAIVFVHAFSPIYKCKLISVLRSYHNIGFVVLLFVQGYTSTIELVVNVKGSQLWRHWAINLSVKIIITILYPHAFALGRFSVFQK
jgi:hypothetical protein